MPKLLAALTLGLTACDALQLVARPPVPLRSAPGAHLALVMQEVDAAGVDVSPAVEEIKQYLADEATANEPAAEEDEGQYDDICQVAKEALKAEITDRINPESRPDPAVVSELLLALEAKNPTRSPATSTKLNGKWKFLYESTGVKAGPAQHPWMFHEVSETFLTIKEEQPRAEASFQVRAFGTDTTITLASYIEPESAVRLVESFESQTICKTAKEESTEGPIADDGPVGFKLDFGTMFPKLAKDFKRSLLVSYVDEELLVFRDINGRADVLVRCED